MSGMDNKVYNLSQENKVYCEDLINVDDSIFENVYKQVDNILYKIIQYNDKLNDKTQYINGIEEKYDEICDELWYIYCEKEVRMERLRHNRGYSDKKIEQMLKNQLSDEEFESKCDFQLYNSEDVAHTYLQIERKMRTYYESMQHCQWKQWKLHLCRQ